MKWRYKNFKRLDLFSLVVVLKMKHYRVFFFFFFFFFFGGGGGNERQDSTAIMHRYFLPMYSVMGYAELHLSFDEILKWKVAQVGCLIAISNLQSADAFFQQ